MQWFIHALIAVTAIGGMMALYKVPSVKGHNKFVYSFLSFFVATVLSYIVFHKYIYISSEAVLFGLLWGAGFAIVTMLQMELLKKLDTNAVFPITSLSSHVLVVIIGLSFFHDKVSPLQFLGIILTFTVIGFYNKVHKHITLKNGLIPIVVGLVLLSTATKFVQKFGSITIETKNFIFWQLFFAMIVSLIILIFVKRKELTLRIRPSKQIVLWAIALGTFNFIGTAEIVKALSTGPFSLVYTVNSFYIIITSLIAWKFFGEELTKRKVVFFVDCCCHGDINRAWVKTSRFYDILTLCKGNFRYGYRSLSSSGS